MSTATEFSVVGEALVVNGETLLPDKPTRMGQHRVDSGDVITILAGGETIVEFRIPYEGDAPLLTNQLQLLRLFGMPFCQIAPRPTLDDINKKIIEQL